jgi:hypothetical protein
MAAIDGSFIEPAIGTVSPSGHMNSLDEGVTRARNGGDWAADFIGTQWRRIGLDEFEIGTQNRLENLP